MRKTLQKQTRKIERAAETLCEAYDAETLHRLRVAIRRIRSLLKARGKRRRRRFRRTWGGFAHTTNRARDWDVFLEQAGELMDGKSAERLRASCRSPVEASHQAVLETLRSAHWREHLEEWKAHLERTGIRDSTAPGGYVTVVHASKFAAILARTREAMAVALAGDDDANWHRLRIAIKETRYQAEREPRGKPGPDPRAVVRSCKRLQESLGAWHDCVVQLQLLSELEQLSPEAARLARALRPTILRLQKCHLVEARRRLTAQSLFNNPP